MPGPDHLSDDRFRPFDRDEIEQSVVSRFQRQLSRHAGRSAVVTSSVSWTYRELDARASQVAASLIERLGTQAGCIALLFDHGAEMIAAILGVLKAGKHYLPLDASYPVQRLKLMLEDARPQAIVAGPPSLVLAAELARTQRILLLNVDDSPTNGPFDSAVDVQPGQLAYVLYTSGSTGRPKAVGQTHRNLLHHIRVWTNALRISAGDRLSLQSAFSWDSAVQDTFGAILNGATLCPVSIAKVGMGGLLPFLRDTGVTVYHSTVPIFRSLVNTMRARAESLAGLRLIALGGDFIYRRDFELYRDHFAHDCQLVNAYGATESSSALLNICDRHVRFDGNLLPLGRPVGDTVIDLVDREGQAVEGEGEGEIVIRSPYIAPGYGLPDRYPAGPGGPSDDSSRRSYATGDIGRRLGNGKIVLVGRRDFQVKIDGMRVEIGEVEGTFKQHDQIGDVVVMAREDVPGERYLAAYVVPASRNGRALGLGVDELRAYLAESLPAHCIPSRFVFLSALPLTANGKIDRRNLPAPDGRRPALTTEFVRARTRLERQLVEIWSDILSIADVGIDDNFFDVGGTSLRMALLQQRVGQVLGRDVTMIELYRSPTIRSFLQAMQADGRGSDWMRRAESRAERRSQMLAWASGRRRSRRKRGGTHP